MLHLISGWIRVNEIWFLTLKSWWSGHIWPLCAHWVFTAKYLQGSAPPHAVHIARESMGHRDVIEWEAKGPECWPRPWHWVTECARHEPSPLWGSVCVSQGNTPGTPTLHKLTWMGCDLMELCFPFLFHLMYYSFLPQGHSLITLGSRIINAGRAHMA